VLLSFEGVPVDPNLEIIALSDTSWRVCDNRFPPAAPNGMLAYIERDERGVEVLLLRPGSAETLHADCLAAALSLISARCAARSDQRANMPR
jgi:hypothetical protein